MGMPVQRYRCIKRFCFPYKFIRPPADMIAVSVCEKDPFPAQLCKKITRAEGSQIVIAADGIQRRRNGHFFCQLLQPVRIPVDIPKETDRIDLSHLSQ